MCGVSSKLMFESCANVTVNAAILDPAICVCDLMIKKEQTNMAAPPGAQTHSKKKYFCKYRQNQTKPADRTICTLSIF